LELQALPPPGGFADQSLAYPLLCRSRCPRDAIQLSVAGTPSPPQQLTAGETVLTLPWQPQRRGLQPPGRLRIQTTAPLGLFVCWTLWDPPVRQPVYAARRPGPVASLSAATGPNAPAHAATTSTTAGSSHWHDLRPHRPEDGLARLAWKSLAQGRGRQTKTFADEQLAPPLLAAAPAVHWEQALEHLSAEIWRRWRAGEPYGLVLGGTELAPATGAEHRDRCLLALAEAPGAAGAPPR